VRKRGGRRPAEGVEREKPETKMNGMHSRRQKTHNPMPKNNGWGAVFPERGGGPEKRKWEKEITVGKVDNSRPICRKQEWD
jgi:hypothetical protein